MKRSWNSAATWSSRHELDLEEEEKRHIWLAMIMNAAPAPAPSTVPDPRDASRRNVEAAPLLALVAHDDQKILMASFARTYKPWLAEFRLTGTETTCKMLVSIGLKPEELSVPSGPLGGDQVLGGMIAVGHIKALFFFRDPLSAHPHNSDIEALGRLADVHQIYFASNYRTASAVIEIMHKQLLDDQVPRDVPDLAKMVQEKYLQNRQAVANQAAASSSA